MNGLSRMSLAYIQNTKGHVARRHPINAPAREDKVQCVSASSAVFANDNDAFNPLIVLSCRDIICC